MVKIRQATAEEKEVMLEISLDSGNPVDETWFENLIKSGEKFFIAKIDNMAVGFTAYNLVQI